MDMLQPTRHRHVRPLAAVFVWLSCTGACAAQTAFSLDPARAASPAPYPLMVNMGDPDHARFYGSLELAGLVGPVYGYMQVPAGGVPGSSSEHRPTFKELGINDFAILDVSATLGLNNNQIYLGGQYADAAGTRTLGQELVTNGVTFPAGTRLHSEVDLDWARLGYRYRWVAVTDHADRPVLTIYPSLGGAILFVDYTVHGGGQRANRTFTKGLPQVGLDAEWRPGGGRFAVEAGMTGFPHFGSIPSIITEQLAAKFDFVRLPGLLVTGFLGVDFQQIYYRDNQSEPNHVNADFGPMAMIGCGVAF